MNEPRWKNTDYEWNGGNDEGRTVVNHLNKAFVDAVRATGGNNQYRFLMVCPYAANSTEPALAALELPDDDRLIVSVHAYIPYSFALAQPGTDKWIASKVNCTVISTPSPRCSTDCSSARGRQSSSANAAL